MAFRALLDGGDGYGYTLAVIAAVNTVIAAAYYMKVLREMWMKPVPDGDTAPIQVPQPIWAALGICADRHASCSASCPASCSGSPTSTTSPAPSAAEPDPTRPGRSPTCDQTVALRSCGRFGAIRHAELAQDVRDV